jgi:multidrug efflux pump
VVISRSGGGQVLLGDVAQIEVAPEDTRGEYRINGKPAIGLGILRQSTANTLSVADGVKAEVERIRGTVPEGVEVVVGYDESLFISQSIYEVEHALMIALILVVVVIFIFLRSWRATIIPAVAIPVSITASFIALAALGFSINVLTLLGLVLAIGLVVDDAIVVLENVHRRIEEGSTRCSPRCAARGRSPSRSSPPRSCWSPCSCRCPSWAATPAGCSPSSASRWRPPSCSRA